MKKIDVDTRKLIGTIVGSIAFICCIIFMTYAFYTWRSENLVVNKNITDESSNIGNIIIENEPTITITNMGPVLHIKDGEIAEFKVTNESDAAVDIFIDLKIEDMHEGKLSNNSFKYAITKSTISPIPEENTVIDKSTLEYDYDNLIASGDFNNTTINTTLTLGTDEVLENTTNYYQIIFYIDGNIKNPNSIMNAPGETETGHDFVATLTIKNSDNPTANISTTKTSKSTSQVMTLTCSDKDGITSYYLGGSSPTSSSSYTTVTSQPKMTMSTTVNSPSTYYFACKDSKGNTSTIKKVSFYRYTIQTMLLNITGVEGSYNQTNYTSLGTSSQYLASDIDTFKLSTYYTVPTGANDSTYKGYSIGTVSFNNNSTIKTGNYKLLETTAFVAWFNRIEYPIQITAQTGGSITARRERNASIVAATATSGTTKTVNVRHNETLTLTASPSKNYTFASWSGGSTATTATIRPQITATKSFTAKFNAK